MNLIENLLVIIFWLINGALIHIVVCQLSPSKFMLKGLLLGILGTVSLAFYFNSKGTVDITGLIIFLTAWLFYLMAFINLLNSATLKMLERLYNEPKGHLYSEDFKFVFNEEDGLKTRLASMELNGFIKMNSEKILLTSKAQLLLKIIFTIRKLLSIDQVG